MRYRAFVLGLVLAGGSSAAAEQPWLKATSSHFELLTDAGEKQAREAILYFEQVRGFFVQVLGLKIPANRVRIVGFRSAAEFKRYQPRSQAAAFATQDYTGHVIAMGGISVAEYPVAVHEFTHTIISSLKVRLPLWLNEGFAEVFSTLRTSGRKITVGVPDETQLLVLRRYHRIPLEAVLTATPQSREYNDPALQPAFYAQSWALVHMLDLDERYRAKFPEFLIQVGSGNTPAGAFLRLWGKDMDQIEGDFRLYSQLVSFPIAIYNVALDKSAETPELGSASPAESGVALANLLVGTSRAGEAAAEYERLAREYPGSPEPAEAAAYLALSHGQQDRAREQLARAVTLGSRRASVFADYANLLSSEDPAQAAKMSARAVSLEPGDNSYQRTYCLMLVNAQRYEEAAKQFDQIKEIDPEHAFEMFHAAAYANYRSGETKKAQALLERARSVAKGNETRMIEQLQAALDLANRPAPLPAAPSADAAAPKAPSAPPRQAAPMEPAPAPEEPAEEPVEKVKLVAVEGVLDKLDCLGREARVRLRVAGQPVILIIEDPRVGDTPLSCGAQRPRTVRVEYVSKAGAGGSAGTIRTIRYK